MGLGGAASLLGVLLAAAGCAVPPPPAPIRTVYRPVHPVTRPPMASASLPPYRSQPVASPTSKSDLASETSIDSVVVTTPTASATPAPVAPKAPAKVDPAPVSRSAAATPSVSAASDGSAATPVSTAPQPRARVPLGGFRPLPTYGSATTGS